MDKRKLLDAVEAVRAGWEEVIEQLGPDGLERPGACGEWRVRDVLAHCNGWDRWQLVQLRCAFSGETPTDAELTGGIVYPPNDDMHEDAMNAMFISGASDLPLDEVVRHWRENSTLRADFVAGASPERLDETIGADWTGGTNRIIRLASEVPSVTNQERVWQRIADQVEHQRAHLDGVRGWMGT